VDMDILTGLGRWAASDAQQTQVESTLRRTVAAGGSSGGAQRSGAVDKTSKLYEACVQFESLLVKQMLTAMRKTVSHDGLGRDIFEDMLYDEYALSMARTAGFGLADTLYRHLTASQAQALLGA
jgi:flagellar protein FlgJ